MASRTQRIITARKELLGSFCEFANLANGWDPEAEGDWDDLVETVDEVLEKLMGGGDGSL